MSEIKKLTKYCRSQGILTLKVGDIEINLSPQALFPTPTKTNHDDGKDVINEDQPTEEDMLFWSSAGIPEREDN